MFLKTGARLASLLRQAVLPVPFPGIRAWLCRVAVLALCLPPFLLLQVMHWIGFLLDELLFRGYRRIDVHEPVFVLGVPRSGTTFMHRLLAADPAFTTFSTWECLFAPSIAERYLWRGIGAIDRRIGRPLGWLAASIERRVARSMDGIHAMSLRAPEEDYLVFLPLFCSFILVVPFPEAEWLWRMGRFDRDVDEKERSALLRWYRRCLQKHLYVNGRERRILSKNASFAGMACSLADAFPGCRLVICERDALQAVASQLNSLSGGLRLFGMSPDAPRFCRRLLDCLDFYYENLARVAARLPEARVARVPLWHLSRDTRAVLEAISKRFSQPLAPEVDAALSRYEARPRPAEPEPAPPLTAWGLDPEEVGTRFAAFRHEEALRL